MSRRDQQTAVGRRPFFRYCLRLAELPVDRLEILPHQAADRLADAGGFPGLEVVGGHLEPVQSKVGQLGV